MHSVDKMELNKSYRFEFIECKEPNIISINIILSENVEKLNNLNEWATILMYPLSRKYQPGDSIIFSQYCREYIRGRFIRYRDDLDLCEIYATDLNEKLTVSKDKLCLLGNEKINNFPTKQCFDIKLSDLELGEYVSNANNVKS